MCSTSAVEIRDRRIHYLYYNGHGDLAAEADASGTRTALHTYDPFGAPLDTPPANSTAHRFTGKWDKQYDTTSSLVLMGARPYDPSLGRFLAVDPVDGGSLNNYDYAGQDPINGYDLAGTRTEADMSDGGNYKDVTCSSHTGDGGTTTTFCETEWIVDVGSDATLIVTDYRQVATQHGQVISRSETPGTSTYESDQTSVGGGLPGSKACTKQVVLAVSGIVLAGTGAAEVGGAVYLVGEGTVDALHAAGALGVMGWLSGGTGAGVLAYATHC